MNKLSLKCADGTLVSPIALGTLYFGSRISQENVDALLDTFFALGGRQIDTARSYADWLPGGESASETGRDHIPTRVFKQMARLNKQHDKLVELLSDMKFSNYKEKSAQIVAFLEKYIPDVAAMETQMKKYEKFFKTADGKQKALEKKNADLSAALEESEKESTVKKLQEMRLHSDYERIKGILDRIPPEIIRAYTHRDSKTQEVRHYR